MPTINIPPKVRFALYLLSALGSVVVAYLAGRGIIGEAETAAWAGVVAIVNGLAAANTNISGDPVVKVRDAVVEGEVDASGTQYPILGKALYSDADPTVEKPGGMRARDENGRADVLYILACVVLVIVLLALVGVI